MVNQALLKTVAECEYPEEFLVARLLGKKGTMFRNWEFLIASSDAIKSLQNTPFYPYLKKFGVPGIWDFLHHEHLWVYSRMNNRLHDYFDPYFAYHEIKRLKICLRSLWSSKASERISDELRNTLLHNDIQEILGARHEFPEMLYELESRLCAYSHHFAGLCASFENKGIIGVEFFLRDSFFTSFFSQKQPLLMKLFFHSLVDYFNCMSVAKSLRWEIAAEPPTIPGGTVPTKRFKKAYFSKDLTPVLKFLHLDDPEAAASSLPRLEISLLRSITFRLKAWSYQRTVVADILFYLWEQYRYTRNISMVLNTVLLDDEPVRASLVT